MEKDYLAEYVIGRIHELEKDVAETRKERDRYKDVLSEVKDSAKTVFKHLKYDPHTYMGGQEVRIYCFNIWDPTDKGAYETLKHLLRLLGIADPGEENEGKECDKGTKEEK